MWTITLISVTPSAAITSSEGRPAKRTKLRFKSSRFGVLAITSNIDDNIKVVFRVGASGGAAPESFRYRKDGRDGGKKKARLEGNGDGFRIDRLCHNVIARSRRRRGDLTASEEIASSFRGRTRNDMAQSIGITDCDTVCECGMTQEIFFRKNANIQS